VSESRREERHAIRTAGGSIRGFLCQAAGPHRVSSHLCLLKIEEEHKNWVAWRKMYLAICMF
jgi:hypothetical protein